MTPRSLQTVLRTLVDGPPVPDAELLRRFLGGDGHAFGELVRRHGRLVWSACRSLTRSEAEADDAFQATFLVLLKHARKVKDPAKLSAWLHGAAYRVCANARQAAARRAARETAAAVREGNGHAVPGAAWDRALAVVHEEVARLTESQRVPFVLCCLEGLSPAEAARRLGLNRGTFDSRLSRAKDALLARLDARGLTLGAVAGLGPAAPPTTAVASAAALAHAGSIVPASLLTLSHGVVGMSVNPLKALAAAALVACGVGGTVGPSFLTSAGAQPPGAGRPAPAPAAAQADPAAELKALRAQMADVQRKLDDATAKLAAARAGAQDRAARTGPEAGFKTARHEYALVLVDGLDAARLRQVVTDREAGGWEFAGTAPLAGATACVFRKAATPAVTAAGKPPPRGGFNPLAGGTQLPQPAPGSYAPSADPAPLLPPATTTRPPFPEEVPPPPAADPGAEPVAPPTPTPAQPPPAAGSGKPEQGLPPIETGDILPSPLPAAPPTPAHDPAVSQALPTLTPPATPSTPPTALDNPTPTPVAPAEPPSVPAGSEPGMARAGGAGPTDPTPDLQNVEEIRQLQARLAELMKPPAVRTLTVSFQPSRTPLSTTTLAQVLTEMGRKKFGSRTGIVVRPSVDGVTVTGSKEVTDWAAGVVKQLGSQSGSDGPVINQNQ